jgi:hypothetical protein
MFLGELSCPFGGHLAGLTLDETVSNANELGGEQVPADVAEVLRRCFQTEPEQRWESLAGVVDALCSVFQDATGTAYNKVLRKAILDDSEQCELPKHDRYSRTPEEWLEYADKLTGKPPRRKDLAAATAKGSLVEGIRIMDEVIPVMGGCINDHSRETVQRYYDAIYVAADLHRRLSDEHGCLNRFRSAIETLHTRQAMSPSVRLVLAETFHGYADALRDFGQLGDAAGDDR